MEITAHIIPDADVLPLVPAGKKRDWTPAVKGSALCLPLFIANQWGWWLLNDQTFTVRNDGGEIEITPENGFVAAHFGFGVMSVLVPYRFQTPDGWNLWMRGPVNYFKTGAHPFEGIVEADWHPGTALMNWYIEDGVEVTFEEGEPLAQILPIQRNIEEFSPIVKNMEGDILNDYTSWRDRRINTFATIEATGRAQFEGSYRERTEKQSVELRQFADIV